MLNAFMAFALVLGTSPTSGQDLSEFCTAIAGATIVADDGTYLGVVASEGHAKSIFNKFGPHGSEFAANSIWNEFGRYGGEFARLSPFNDFTSTPPLLIKNGRAIARLTTNKVLRGAVSPHVLRACDL